MHSVTDAQGAATAKSLMARRDMTRDQLAKASGVPERTLDRWLDGQGSLHMDRVEAVARALGTTVSEMTSGAAA